MPYVFAGSSPLKTIIIIRGRGLSSLNTRVPQVSVAPSIRQSWALP